MNRCLPAIALEKACRLSDSDFILEVAARNNYRSKGQERRFKYRTTNEDVGELKWIFGSCKGKTLLAVSSSGVFALELLAAEDPPALILSFDYSPRQVAYNYLLKSAVRLFSYQDFRRYFFTNTAGSGNKAIRRQLVQSVPKRYVKYLQRQHAFCRRDHKLNEENSITWWNSRARYANVKRNIERIKFFEFEISHKNTRFSELFPKRSFDIIYLSNTLDWLCWHNSDIEDTLPLSMILSDIRCIVKEGGVIVLTSLLDRDSHVPALLKQMQSPEQSITRFHHYTWLNSKIHV